MVVLCSVFGVEVVNVNHVVETWSIPCGYRLKREPEPKKRYSQSPQRRSPQQRIKVEDPPPDVRIKRESPEHITRGREERFSTRREHSPRRDRSRTSPVRGHGGSYRSDRRERDGAREAPSFRRDREPWRERERENGRDREREPRSRAAGTDRSSRRDLEEDERPSKRFRDSPSKPRGGRSPRGDRALPPPPPLPDRGRYGWISTLLGGHLRICVLFTPPLYICFVFAAGLYICFGLTPPTHVLLLYVNPATVVLLCFHPTPGHLLPGHHFHSPAFGAAW